MERRDAVIVGGGQAAMSVSHELGLLGVEHVVLERRRVGQAWRDRWDSFCPHAGDDPERYLPCDEIVGSQLSRRLGIWRIRTRFAPSRS